MLLAAPWVIVLATLGLYANGRRAPAPTPAPLTRFSLSLAPAPQVETGFPWQPVAMSPDGSRLVYVGIPATGQQLFMRRFDAVAPAAVAGTASAINPFFSADGTQLAFISANRLMKVPVDGGAPIQIAQVSNNFWGGTWFGDSILFADDRGLVMVSSGGGDPVVVLPREPNVRVSWRWPEFLPDGRSVVLAANEEGVDRVAVFTLADRVMRRTEIIGANPHYVSQGFIVVALFAPGGPTNAVGSGTLVAIPFDPGQLKALGSAIPISENVQVGPVSRSAKAAISRTGTIAFAPGAIGLYSVFEVDRSGNARDIGAEPRYYSGPRLSPDGRRVAVTVQEPSVGTDIWVFDRVVRGGLTRLTFDKTASRPIWTRDGTRIAYQRTGNLQDLAWIASDGSSAAPETLFVGDDDQVPGAFTPDGRALVIREGGVSSPRRISMIPLDTPRTSQSIVSTSFDAHSPSLSPDGKWMAYASMESNSPQIYVRPFPGPGGKWQISRDGGIEPRWSPAGGEIFFRSGDRIMSVAVTTNGGTFSHGDPRSLFSFRITQAAPQYVNYDVTRDGKTFIMVQAPLATEQASMIVLLNWFDNQRAKN
jgi:Tol biopolymer transport system component